MTIHKRLRVPILATMLVAVLSWPMSGCKSQSSRAEGPTDGSPISATTPRALEATNAAGASTPQATQSLSVFAGAASQPALSELAKSYQEKTGIKVDVTFGGSGTLLTQLTREQYGDAYIPGSNDFMDKAEKTGAVLKETRTILAYLVPVLAVAKGNPKNVKSPEDLARKDLRVVVAEPKAVCLGDIAEGLLTKLGLWEKVKPNIASYATSCEDTLNNLLMGEADVVIGWDAWARQHPEAVESIPLPKELAPVYNIPAAVITWSKQPEAVKAFIAYLASEEGKAVFHKHGYTVEKQSQ